LPKPSLGEIRVLTVFSVLSGLVYLVGGGTLLALTGAGALASPLGYVIGVANLAVGLACFILGYGSWGGKSWAWSIGIVIAPISILEAIAQIVSISYPLSIPGTVLVIVMAVTIVFLLTRPRVRAFLGKGRP
jgi:hypothetical protein